MLRPVRPEGLPHRRLDPFHRQQPDRLHHQSALLALLALSVRRRQDDRGADLPRQRRRSGSGGVRRQGRDRIPAEVPEAGRHRHVLLSPPRPQRRRRAGVHPAADVQEDPRRIRRRWRSIPSGWSPKASITEGEVEKMQGRLARPARRRARGRPGLQAQQGRLARRQLGRLQVGRQRRRSAPRQHRRRRRRRCKDIGRKITKVPDGFQRPPHHPALPGEPRARRSRPARASTGRPAEALAFCTLLQRRPSRSACPARTPSAAPSRSAIRC